MDTMLANGSWLIRNMPFIMKKLSPDTNIMKENVCNVPVWVKLHDIPFTAFTEDSLSAIATKLGTPMMQDSYTSTMSNYPNIYSFFLPWLFNIQIIPVYSKDVSEIDLMYVRMLNHEPYYLTSHIYKLLSIYHHSQ